MRNEYGGPLIIPRKPRVLSTIHSHDRRNHIIGNLIASFRRGNARAGRVSLEQSNTCLETRGLIMSIER